MYITMVHKRIRYQKDKLYSTEINKMGKTFKKMKDFWRRAEL